MAFIRKLALRPTPLISNFYKCQTPLPALPGIHSLFLAPSRQICYTLQRKADAPGTQGGQAKSSTIARIISVVTIALFFTTAGFVIGAIPALQVANDILYPPTDDDTLTMYTPKDDVSRKVENYINKHPLVKELRSRPDFLESRPHLKIPSLQRAHNLTGGVLLGPGRVIVPPFAWTERDGKSLVAISYLGSDLCGHPGIVHGGFLATMLDEGMGRCCFSALPNNIGMTANLDINYRTPAPAGVFVVLRARTTKVEGRKAWVEARIETLVSDGEKPIVLVEASSLFIEPRQAATVAKVYPVSQ